MQAKVNSSSLSSILKSIPQGKPTYIWDTELSGFGLYVSGKGEVSYLVQRWVGGRDGKATRHVIGRQKDGMDLQEAKRQATTAIADLLNGRETQTVKAKATIKAKHQKEQEEKSAIVTKDALTQFLARHKATGRYRDEMEKTLYRALKPHLSKKLKNLTKSDLSTILEDYTDTPAALRTLFAALRPFFNDCVSRELIPSSPLQTFKTPSPVASRDRTLSKNEIRLFWLASYHPDIPSTWGAFYRTLLLTGQRREEVSGMRFEEVDFEQSTWTIPKERAKNKKAHIVHLSPLALQEINSSPRANERKGFVFPAQKLRNKREDHTEAHLSGYSKMKTKLDDVMKTLAEEKGETFVPFRLHDLRRTVASGMAELVYSPDVIDRLLNHVSGSQSGVKGVYQRYQFLKERQEAILGWSDYISRLVKD